MKNNSPPTVLFGIDGATFQLFDPLMHEGKLPNLQRLKALGAYGQLQSTIHPLTPAAWISMCTGLNPGKHGVYDFIKRKEATYDWELVSSKSRHGKPIWSILSEKDKKVGIFNVPVTYPPDQVNGFMISGMGTPHGKRNFVYPESLGSKFYARFPNYLTEPDVRTRDLHEYLRRNEELLNFRLKALDFVWNENLDLDFFMPVFIVTDRIQHVYWNYLDPNSADYNTSAGVIIREKIYEIYQKIDAMLGKLWNWVNDLNGYILVASDHGFGPLQKDVYINKWLIDNGYLVMRSDAPAYTVEEERFFYQVDWARTRAYSFGYFGNINVNLRTREPRGIVNPGREAETIKNEITAGLEKVTDAETGEFLIDAIYRKEELYSGPHLEQAPDLLLIMKDYAYMTRGGFDFNSPHLFGSPMEHVSCCLHHTGNHRMDGVLMMAGPGIKKGMHIQNANITDVAPTVLHLLDSAIPADLDGRVLTEAFEDDFVIESPPVYESFAVTDSNSHNKSVEVQLLEKDVRISLLDEEIRHLQHLIRKKDKVITKQDEIIAGKDKAINDLVDHIEKVKNGRIMSILSHLNTIKTKISP